MERERSLLLRNHPLTEPVRFVYFTNRITDETSVELEYGGEPWLEVRHTPGKTERDVLFYPDPRGGPRTIPFDELHAPLARGSVAIHRGSMRFPSSSTPSFVTRKTCPAASGP